jgi:hypothetical protein
MVNSSDWKQWPLFDPIPGVGRVNAFDPSQLRFSKTSPTIYFLPTAVTLQKPFEEQLVRKDVELCLKGNAKHTGS